MSAFADQPSHLLNWLPSRGALSGVAGTTPFCFIPRGIYGAYLADLVGELRAGGALRHVRDRCVDLVQEVDDVVLTLESGNTLVAEFVVLATGNDPKPALNGIPAVRPWSRRPSVKSMSAALF
jgi:uncharacterized NAD(P)/FAD-binding protein YdhS